MSGTTLAILSFLNVISAVLLSKSKPTLLVLKNVDGVEVPVSGPWVIIIQNGKNLTLTCKMSNLESPTYLDNQVLWSRKTSALKFQNKNDMSWLVKGMLYKRSITEESHSELVFTPVTLQDRGTYFCTNVKHNLIVSLQVIVRPDKQEKCLKNVNRRKRAQLGYNYQWRSPRGTGEPQVPRVNFPDPVGDFLYNKKKVVHPETPVFTNTGGYYKQWHKIYSTDFGSDWTAQNIYKNPSSNKDLYKTQRTVTLAKRKIKYGVIYFLAGTGGLVFISMLMVYATQDLIKHRRLQRQARLNSTCVHMTSPTPWETDSSEGSVPNSSSHMPVRAVHRDDSDRSTVVTTRGVRDETEEEQLDAPPSYANSAGISVENSDARSAARISAYDTPPPSYDEALANIMSCSSAVINVNVPIISHDNT